MSARRAEPYQEADLPAPGSVYALSKLAGEHAALAYCRRALVVRTAGLYGLHGSQSKGGNFVTRMLKRAREQGELRASARVRWMPGRFRPYCGRDLPTVSPAVGEAKRSQGPPPSYPS